MRVGHALIIGAMKCGTTSLFAYLDQHPDIACASTKELDYFSVDDNWARGWAWYRAQWPADAATRAWALEASTSYTKLPAHPHAAERIAASPARFKLIYLVRDPLERIESHYSHGRRLGWVESQRPLAEHIAPRLVQFSRYATQLAPYEARFPASDLLVLDAAALERAPGEVLARVCAFLEISTEITFDASGRFNTGAEWERLPATATGEVEPRARLTPAQRREIARALRDELTALERRHGIAVRSWPTWRELDAVAR